MNSKLDEYKAIFDRLKGRNATLKDWFDAGYDVGFEDGLSLANKRSKPIGEDGNLDKLELDIQIAEVIKPTKRMAGEQE